MATILKQAVLCTVPELKLWLLILLLITFEKDLKVARQVLKVGIEGLVTVFNTLNAWD